MEGMENIIYCHVSTKMILLRSGKGPQKNIGGKRKMRLSDIKEVYALVEENMFLPNWTTRQQVNDFIEWLECQEDIKKEGWNRSNRNMFPYALDELFLDYAGYEGFLEDEEEIEIILPLDLKSQWQEDLENYLQSCM